MVVTLGYHPSSSLEEQMTKEQLVFKELAGAARSFMLYAKEKVGLDPDEPRYVRFRRALGNAQQYVKKEVSNASKPD
jgi:hypothetical protein